MSIFNFKLSSDDKLILLKKSQLDLTESCGWIYDEIIETTASILY